MQSFQKVLVVEGGARTLDYALSAELAGLGLASVTAALEATDDIVDVIPTPSAILFHLPSGSTAADYEPFLALAERLRRKDGLSNVPMIVVEPGQGASALPAGLSLFDQPSSKDLRAELDRRFAQAARLRRMDDELERRMRSLETLFGERETFTALRTNHRPSRVVLAGRAQALNVLKPLLELQGVETRREADPRLAELRAADLIVIAASDEALIRRLRRDRALAAIPIMVIPEQGCGVAAQGMGSGTVDVLDLEASVAECVDGIVLRASEQRHRDLLGLRLAATNVDLIDPATGLCKPVFFRHHLKSVVHDALRDGEAVTVAIVRDLPNETRVDSTVPPRRRIAEALAHVLRAEDFATELSFGVFAIAFVGADRDTAKALLDRISVLVRRTGITGSNDSAAIGITTGLADLTEGDTSLSIVARAHAASGA